MSDFTKAIFLALAVIVCVVIGGIAIRGTKNGKSAYDQKSAEMDKMTSEFIDMDLASYDGSSLLGSSLLEVIKTKQEKDEKVAIVVKTLANTAGKNYCYTYSNGTLAVVTPPAGGYNKDITSADYINPSAQFLGEVTKNDNNNVVVLTFSQQK